MLERGFERCGWHRAESKRPGEGVATHTVDHRTLTDDGTALRTTEHLVATKAGRMYPCGHSVRGSRLTRESRMRLEVDESATAEVIHVSEPTTPRECGEVLQHRRLRKSVDPKITRMDGQNNGNVIVFVERSLIIREPRAVRRADFNHVSPRTLEHFGDSKSAANFDELAAGHEDSAPVRHRRQHEENSRRVVVHHERRFGTG